MRTVRVFVGFELFVHSVGVYGFQVCAWIGCEVAGKSTNVTLTRLPWCPLFQSPRRHALTVSISFRFDYSYA